MKKLLALFVIAASGAGLSADYYNSNTGGGCGSNNQRGYYSQEQRDVYSDRDGYAQDAQYNYYDRDGSYRERNVNIQRDRRDRSFDRQDNRDGRFNRSQDFRDGRDQDNSRDDSYMNSERDDSYMNSQRDRSNMNQRDRSNMNQRDRSQRVGAYHQDNGSQRNGYYNHAQAQDQQSNGQNNNKTAFENERELNKKIQDSIKSAFSNKYDNVTVASKNGNVMLTGTVATQEDKNDLEEKVRDIDGVKNINNQVRVAG